ncbi:signal peptidase I [Opitutaceae bacterium EW11]|nr:signal peptidase I [Opitutaceae bacterium EW11]
MNACSCAPRPAWRTAAFAAAAVLALAFAGCASTVPTAAPRSAVSPETALTLAQITARSVGGQVFTVAPTGSMKPTLDESSVVAVEKVAFSELRQGDIVIYRSVSGFPIVHRLYEHHGDSWLVLGDNNGTVDREAVTAANFVGRVCAIFYTSSGAGTAAATAFAQR